ncbi:hypothetical protein D3C76_1647310 [compost metagenome]
MVLPFSALRSNAPLLDVCEVTSLPLASVMLYWVLLTKLTVYGCPATNDWL